jgi:hypothetical protein
MNSFSGQIVIGMSFGIMVLVKVVSLKWIVTGKGNEPGAQGSTSK